MYLAAVKGEPLAAFGSRTMANATMEIVGWSMSDRLKSTFCLDALGMAIRNRRPPRGLIQHTDSKYAGASVAGRSDPHSDGPFSVAGAAWSPAVA